VRGNSACILVLSHGKPDKLVSIPLHQDILVNYESAAVPLEVVRRAHTFLLCLFRLTGVRSCGNTPFTGLVEYKPKITVFGCFKLGIPSDPTCPHVKLELFNTTVSINGTILRGELLPILRIIKTQMSRKEFAHHLITPVLFLLSLQPSSLELIIMYRSLLSQSSDFTAVSSRHFSKARRLSFALLSYSVLRRRMLIISSYLDSGTWADILVL
jgi:hypothetical protein